MLSEHVKIQCHIFFSSLDSIWSVGSIFCSASAASDSFQVYRNWYFAWEIGRGNALISLCYICTLLLHKCIYISVVQSVDDFVINVLNNKMGGSRHVRTNSPPQFHQTLLRSLFGRVYLVSAVSSWFVQVH